MLRELPSLSLNLYYDTPVNRPPSESDTQWLRACPGGWAKSDLSWVPFLIQGNRLCMLLCFCHFSEHLLRVSSLSCIPFSPALINIPLQSNYCTNLSETTSNGAVLTSCRLCWNQ